jgi:hypothetical protein
MVGSVIPHLLISISLNHLNIATPIPTQTKVINRDNDNHDDKGKESSTAAQEQRNGRRRSESFPAYTIYVYMVSMVKHGLHQT